MTTSGASMVDLLRLPQLEWQKAGLDSEVHVFICHHLALAYSFPGFAIRPGLFGNLILFLALFFMLVYQASAIRYQVSAEIV